MSDTTPPPPPSDGTPEPDPTPPSPPPAPPPAQPPAQPPSTQPYTSTYRDAYGQPHGGVPEGYAAPAYGGGPGVGVPQQHGSATTALVLGVLSWVCCGLLAIPAYIIGRRAEREINASRGRLTGGGLAKAGWILGLVQIVLMVLGVLLLLVLLVTGSLSGSFDTNTGNGY